jgi:Domain of unknown function (DUF6434)/SAP domain-containing new25
MNMTDNKDMHTVPLRPNIENCTSGDEFRRWYYLKSELVDFAKTKRISVIGGKFEIAERIEAVLNSEPIPQAKKRHPISRFDWANASLHTELAITDNISFGPNVRGFFRRQIGPGFVCSSDFMDWVKENIGSTLSEAVDAWKMLESRKSDPEFQTRIRSHNQYNQFTRDILAANPNLTLDAVRQVWRAKRDLPRSMAYSQEDLELLKMLVKPPLAKSTDG